MNRRKFFRFLPVAPVIAGAVLVKEAQADEGPEEKHNNLIELRAGKGSIKLSVGRDGNLWIKPRDEDWKRVVTE